VRKRSKIVRGLGESKGGERMGPRKEGQGRSEGGKRGREKQGKGVRGLGWSKHG